MPNLTARLKTIGGLALEPAYPTITVRAATATLQLSVDASHEQLVLVRGKTAPDLLDELRTDPKVVDTYR